MILISDWHTLDITLNNWHLLNDNEEGPTLEETLITEYSDNFPVGIEIRFCFMKEFILYSDVERKVYRFWFATSYETE